MEHRAAMPPAAGACAATYKGTCSLREWLAGWWHAFQGALK